MVDNFELIKGLLHFEGEGDCYYVQLLRRAADDPKPGGIPDPKYHGNMHSRSVKDYFIRSIQHLDDVADEIRTMCTAFGVRAYIRLNRRSYKKIALQMLKHIAEQAQAGESYSSPHHLVSSAAGLTSNELHKTWLVDIDKEYLRRDDDILHLIAQCEPICRGIEGDAHLEELWKSSIPVIPTKSGEHFVVPPFNRQQFSVAWQAYTAHWGISLKEPDIHKDNPTVLYIP